MVIFCERCKTEIHKYEQCNYCNRKICINCTKSTQKTPKTRRLIICKDCWSVMPRRSAYKNRKSAVVTAEN